MKTNLIYYNIKASKPSILKTDPHLRYQNKKKHTKLIEFPRQKYVSKFVFFALVAEMLKSFSYFEKKKNSLESHIYFDIAQIVMMCLIMFCFSNEFVPLFHCPYQKLEINYLTFRWLIHKFSVRQYTRCYKSDRLKLSSVL